MGYLMGSSPKTSGKSCSCRHLCRHVATFSWPSKLDLDSQKSSALSVPGPRTAVTTVSRSNSNNKNKNKNGPRMCGWCVHVCSWVYNIDIHWFYTFHESKLKSCVKPSAKATQLDQPSASWIPMLGASSHVLRMTCLCHLSLSNLSVKLVSVNCLSLPN